MNLITGGGGNLFKFSRMLGEYEPVLYARETKRHVSNFKWGSWNYMGKCD